MWNNAYRTSPVVWKNGEKIEWQMLCVHVSTVVFRDLFGVEELSRPLQREQVNNRRNKERLNCAASCVCQFWLLLFDACIEPSRR